MKEDAVLIAGPTASGKSAMALEIADGARAAGRMPIIVNADSMQVYRELRILSARPNDEEMALCEHRFYGFISAAEPFNTGRWLSCVAALLDEVDEPTLPIFVGGTGLYFNALTQGFAEIPTVPDKIREKYRKMADVEDRTVVHGLLEKLDPAAATLLEPSDTQRVLRALEVKEATGTSILTWQEEAQRPALLDTSRCMKRILLPERDHLYERIEMRFDTMMEEGALEEVKALSKMDFDPKLPAMKAIGVPQLMGHLAGKLSLEEAVENAKRESRRYAKRQMTWWRNQMGDDWERIE